MKLTTHLLTHPDFSGLFHDATHSPFLEAAGDGQLPLPALSRWLAQDRLYAQAYVRFASLILAQLKFPAKPDPEDLQWRLSGVLIDALANVRREIGFFDDISARFGVDIEPKEVASATAAYLALFEEAAQAGWQQAMVVLWATEICYLSAWKYAQSCISQFGDYSDDKDGGALRTELIPNWTNEEFEQFVDNIAGLLDEIGEYFDGDELSGAEQLWAKTCQIEKAFWPPLA